MPVRSRPAVGRRYVSRHSLRRVGPHPHAHEDRALERRLSRAAEGSQKPLAVFRSAVSAVAVVLSLVHVSAQSAPGDWVQFRGNARLTGVAAGALPSTLSLHWTYEAGDA